MKKNCPVIFSGHNDRAVIALCRFFSSINRDFFLIAKDKDDAIFQTEWAAYVLIQRQTSKLDIKLSEDITNAVRSKGFAPCLCPTSEFLNRFFLENYQSIIEQGWCWLFPSSKVYEALSDKFTSPAIVAELIGLRAPAFMDQSEWRAPCVLKPKKNLLQGVILYPNVCRTEAELKEALENIDKESWFCQKWVEGQSFYLCAYLDRQGYWNFFWQENLLQQPNGKSIVLARECHNPGLDVNHLMLGLYKLGYSGPFMLEVIRDHEDVLHFIEINPRFWGPLDLARKACPEILQRFVSDMDDTKFTKESSSKSSDNIYAWAYGANDVPLKFYPAAASLSSDQIIELLRSNDVYGYPDTIALSLRH